MKNLTLTFLLFLFFNQTYGQTIRYTGLDSFDKKVDYKTYVSKNHGSYSVGDTITLGQPSGSNKTFSYVYWSYGVFATPEPLGADYAGSTLIVEKVQGLSTKRFGTSISIKCKGILGASILIQIENALESGEMKSNTMTSEEALAKLKEAKDKLDLGLITEEEYLKIKEELRPYIH